MRKGFTLAEVLITLSIIGIVAALTIPGLLGNYRKKQYYTQFMKARSVLENALMQYAFEHGCPQNDVLCGKAIYVMPDFAKDLSKYMNIAQFLTDANAEELCKEYNKHLYMNYDKTRDEPYNICLNDTGSNNIYNGFITNDGMLFSFYQDDGLGSGSVVDVNGPAKGPNIYGRDIFVFYLRVEDNLCGNRWGRSKECAEKFGNTPGCYGDDKAGGNCAVRLILEGKMNY